MEFTLRAEFVEFPFGFVGGVTGDKSIALALAEGLVAWLQDGKPTVNMQNRLRQSLTPAIEVDDTGSASNINCKKP